ncbi:MAG: hypothetical protein J5517_02010 [Eubacterium sp.]|nr:hypothetical protein [Eubacterium sp.]
MKKSFTYIILSVSILLSLCSCSVSKKEDKKSEEVSTEQNGNEDNEKGNDSMINPWVDINEEEAKKGMTHPFKVPDGATDVIWQTYNGNDPSESEVIYNQLLFTMNGTDYCARAYEGINEDADISGMYYEWTATEDDKLSKWGKDGCDCKVSSYVKDDNDSNDRDAMLVEWYDSENSIKYSLSATGNDLNGLDIAVVADMLYEE